MLRIEAIAHNVKDVRCGKRLEKLPDMLAKLKRMAFELLKVIGAAHRSYLGILEDLPRPTQRGTGRLAGDPQKPRIRRFSPWQCEPDGFTVKDLAQKVTRLYLHAPSGFLRPPYVTGKRS